MKSGHRNRLEIALKNGLGIDRYCTPTEEECWSVREGYLQAYLHKLSPEEVPTDTHHDTEQNLKSEPLTPTLPILIGTNSNGGKFVIDGFHRLATAKRNGEKSIKAYILTPHMTALSRSRFNPEFDYIDNFFQYPKLPITETVNKR